MTDDVGKIGWVDMAVTNASEVRDFYAAVVRFCVMEDPGGSTAALYQP